jgi:hypothetical protein
MRRSRASCAGMPEMNPKSIGRNASTPEIIKELVRPICGRTNYETLQFGDAGSERWKDCVKSFDRREP